MRAAGEIDQLLGLPATQRQLIDDEPNAIMVAFRIDTQKHLGPLVCRFPGPSHAQVRNVSPCRKPEFPVLRTIEVESGFGLGEMIGKGRMNGAAKGEECSLEKIACSCMITFVLGDVRYLEKRGDVIR